MIFRPPHKRTFCFLILAILGGSPVPLRAQTSGPTVHFDFGAKAPASNPVAKFMYFVPLICPEPVFVLTNAGNTQRVRILSRNCRTRGASFHAVCDFEFAGAGEERNVIDHTALIRRRKKDLEAGLVFGRQLGAITVKGYGSGSAEIEGSLLHGEYRLSDVRLRFNGHGRPSPVSVTIQDLAWQDGRLKIENEMVARVNLLDFPAEAGAPKMNVSLDSVKSSAAPDGFWQNLVGGLKGAVANLFLPPLPITRDGHQAMMDFGLAIVTAKETFTFPFATRLEKSAPEAPQAVQPAPRLPRLK